VYTLAARCGIPISFIGTGQRIPEDLERAEPERIVDRILSADPSRRTSLAA
jgi:flagellar biosynthesis GTPase FlhF